MKTVEELGISPMPWHKGEGNAQWDVFSKPNKKGESFGLGFVSQSKNHEADARLIAAAPELYVCLCDAVTDFCKDCTHKTNCHDFFIPCPAKKWRRALAKAGGEGVE